MTDFALRGTFFIGAGERDALCKQVDHIMEHLLDVERWSGNVRDAAVSLDAGAGTVEVELVVTAETMAAAHQLASTAVAGAFDSAPEERAVEMVPA